MMTLYFTRVGLNKDQKCISMLVIMEKDRNLSFTKDKIQIDIFNQIVSF